MKRSNAGIILLTIGVTLLFFGCAKDRAALQVARYVNEDILQIAELEERSLNRYASVTGKNFKSEQSVYEALKDFVIPYYGRFVDELREIQPDSEELKRLHKLYLQGAESLYRGFKMKLAGIAQQDEFIIRSANQAIEAGRLKNEAWRRELLELYGKYDLLKESEKVGKNS